MVDLYERIVATKPTPFEVSVLVEQVRRDIAYHAGRLLSGIKYSDRPKELRYHRREIREAADLVEKLTALHVKLCAPKARR